ncbi:hypothetical protein FT986_15010 [Mesonia sp. K4-1]|nr:hypothetical protein FT986_15010 [Mesonia sp. K4-1]
MFFDPNSAFSSISSDNIFKYLTTIGFAMIMVSLFYPLQVKYDLKQEQIEFKKEYSILNKYMDSLNLKISESFKYDSILKNEPDLTPESITTYEDKLDLITKQLNGIEKDPSTEMIKLKYLKNKLRVKNSELKEYENYSSWLTWVGIFSMIIGVIGWLYMIFFWKPRE